MVSGEKRLGKREFVVLVRGKGNLVSQKVAGVCDARLVSVTVQPAILSRPLRQANCVLTSVSSQARKASRHHEA